MYTESRYRILMFAPAFAPFANAEAIVNSKLALAMINAGWEIDVISRRLIGASLYDYGSEWADPWTSLRKHTYEIEYPLGNKVSRLADIVRTGLRMDYFIDGCRWASRAYDLGCELHRSRQYDVILSRAFPDFAHLPSLKLAHKCDIPWIANWNDPWEFLHVTDAQKRFDAYPGTIQRKFYEEVARVAAWHTFPSEKLRHEMCRYLGHNVLKHSNAVPHAALTGYSLSEYKKKDVFKICYAGRLWSERDPTLFLTAVRDLIDARKASAKIQITFVGIDDISIDKLGARLHLQDNITCRGRLGYLDTLRECEDSDVLLAIDSPGCNGTLLISKFVDYAQTGRPILAISTKPGTLHEMISAQGGGIVADCRNPEEISRGIHELYASWKDGTLHAKYNSRNLYQLFAPNAIVRSYDDIFRRVGIRNDGRSFAPSGCLTVEP